MTTRRYVYTGGLAVHLVFPTGRTFEVEAGDPLDLLPSEEASIVGRPDFTPEPTTPEEAAP